MTPFQMVSDFSIYALRIVATALLLFQSRSASSLAEAAYFHRGGREFYPNKKIPPSVSVAGVAVALFEQMDLNVSEG